MRTFHIAAVAVAVAIGLAASCGSPRTSTVQRVTKMIDTAGDLDVLFVVDNSASTSDKQTVFAQNFTKFVDALNALPSPSGSGVGRPNLHIGVVSTTVGLGSAAWAYADWGSMCPPVAPMDDGLLHNTAVGPDPSACGTLSGQFISDVADPANPGQRLTNYGGSDLATELGCIAQIGADGCGFEMPLEGMKRALDGSRPENAGFIRPNAYLAVIVLTDEDDCSVADPTIFSFTADQVGPYDFRCQPLYALQCDQPISPTGPGAYTNCHPLTGSGSAGYLYAPSHYADFLATVKDPSQVVVAMIAGDPTPDITTGAITAPFVESLALEPSCSATMNGNLAVGRPAIRLNSFTQSFGEQGIFESVCQADYSDAFSRIGQLVFDMMTPCIEGAIDTTDQDLTNPGLQPSCTVADVIPGGGSGGSDLVEDTISACAMIDATTPDPIGARPCWWVASDSVCATASGLELHVERATPPPAGTTEAVSCAL